MTRLQHHIAGKTILSLLAAGATVTSVWATEATSEAKAGGVQSTSTPAWVRKTCIGISGSRGNTDKSRTHLSFSAEKKGGTNEWGIALEGVYAESDGERSAESAQGSLDHRYFLTRRLYGLLRAQGLYDAMADVDYRVGAGPGVGYYIVKRTNVTVSVETGVSYFWESLDRQPDHYPVARLAERVEWRPSAGLKVWEFGEYMPTLGDSGRSLTAVEVGMESQVRKRLSIQVKASLRLDSDPATGTENEDITYSTSFVYRF